jgi:hypothetical protein
MEKIPVVDFFGAVFVGRDMISCLRHSCFPPDKESLVLRG